MSNKITYRQQYTRCGKQRCKKCKEGSGHGPYWYAYWSENGRTVSKYIGAQLPAGVEIGEQPATKRPSAEKSKIISRRTQPLTSQEAAVPRPLQETQVLRIYLLGQFRVERRVDNTWVPVDNSIWRRRRARALLGCLLSSPGRRLGREQIMEALWPDLDIDTAANRLNGAVHELRQILEPGIARPASSRMLRLERDVLELADRLFIWVDSEAFENLMNEANATPCNEEAERLFEAAEMLYGGDYLLEELYSEWAAPRREAMKRARTSLLFRLSELREQRGAHASALEPLDRLLAADPVNETAVRRLMVLLTRLDRRGEALRAYQRLVTALHRDYETEPLPETRELYEALRLGHLRATPPPASLFASPSSPLPQPAQLQNETATEMLPRLIFQSGRHNQSPLVGRSRELDTMRQLADSIESISGQASNEKTRGGTHTRTPHFLLLTGEAGIGKTRLAEELSVDLNARTWAVVWSRSYEQESTIPYRPWTDLLRALLQDMPSEHLLASLKLHVPGFEETSTAKLERLYALLPELAAREGLPALHPSPSLPPEQERLHLWEVTLDLLSALSKKTPLLLVLDDLHWADDSSIDLLAYLARHLQDQRVLLVGTYRDAEPSSNAKLRTLITDLRREQAVLTLMVQPLTATQIGSLVAYLPQEIVRTIQTQAGGNPFFAEELARSSAPDPASMGTAFNGEQRSSDEQEQDRDAVHEYIPTATHETLPETIASVLERRLSGLSSQCQNLLGKAAVLGGSFELHHLLAMTSEYEEDALLDLLEEALHAGLLAEEGHGARILYRFWHPLIVNHLYKRLSAARRAQLHRRAAAMLEQHAIQQKLTGEQAATIMYHLSRGGDEPAHIAPYAELAGNQAYAVAAYSEAKQYYQQAIQMMTAGQQSNIDPLRVARLQERVCECCMVLGNSVEARQLYEQILELRRTVCENSNEEVQIQALIWREIGRTWSSVGEYMLAYECFEHGKQALSAAGITIGPAWACLLIQHGAICCLQGSYDEARGYVYEALGILEQAMKDAQPPQTDTFLTRTEQAVLGDPLEVGRAHELLGVIAASVGQLSDALKHLYTALEIFEQHDLVIAMAKVCGNLGAAYAMKAENMQARVYMRRSLELTERMGDLPNMAFVTGNLGEMANRSGDLQEAEEWFKRSLAISEQIHDREHMSWCNVALGAVRQDMGRFRESAENLLRALAIGRSMKNSRCIGSALIAMADLRISQAIATGAQFLPSRASIQPLTKYTLLQGEETSSLIGLPGPLGECQRLLLRARSTLRRALALEGLETELTTEGGLLLATASFLLGEIETAREQVLQTMQASQEHEITRILARTQRLLGRIMALEGEHHQADDCFEQAIQIFRENEMLLDFARTLHNYGLTLLQRGQPGEQVYQQGIAYLQQARDTFQSCSATIDLEWITFQLSMYEAQYIEDTLSTAETV